VLTSKSCAQQPLLLLLLPRAQSQQLRCSFTTVTRGQGGHSIEDACTAHEVSMYQPGGARTRAYKLSQARPQLAHHQAASSKQAPSKQQASKTAASKTARQQGPLPANSLWQLTVPERAASSIDFGKYTAAASSALSCSSDSTCSTVQGKMVGRQHGHSSCICGS
jgi:hypothetical protein